VTGPRLVLEVARWEFRRFFKVKEQLLTLAIIVAGGVLFWGFHAIWERGKEKPVRVAVVQVGAPELRLVDRGRVRLVRSPASAADSLADAVGRGRLDGLLFVRAAAHAELLVTRPPIWRDDLEAVLNEARREERFRSLGVDSSRLADALAPLPVEVRYHEATGAGANRGARIWAVLFVVATLIGLYLGNAYLFIGITGEKQARVTEQVVAAVSPQTWIDGKILGLSGMALVSILNLGLGLVLFSLIPVLTGWTTPETASFAAAGAVAPPEPVAFQVTLPYLALLCLFALMGFFFWFTLFAAVAATINNPHTSNRSAFLFLPALPTVITFLGVKEPDGILMRVLSLLPITANAALPVRLTVTNVAWWEVPAALLILLISIGLLRRMAGKIFAAGMLLYGKEPSLREMWRWVREA
jgi:ABC-2 type transport system permease protein